MQCWFLYEASFYRKVFLNKLRNVICSKISVNEFIFSKVSGIQPPTLPEMNFFTGTIQRFCELFRNSYFKEHFSVAASTRFSLYLGTFEHFICLSYCLQKETNQHKYTCDNICDMLKLMIFTNVTFYFFLVYCCYFFSK